MSSFKQSAHKLLLIPGPVECHDDVLLANAHPSMSHVSPAFAPSFAYCIKALRKVLYAPTAQPFIIAGSGTLGWDLVAANLIEAGQNALVLNSGYFGDSFADCLETYGAKVTQVKAPVGGRPSLEDVEAALKKDKYALMTFTHVRSTKAASEVDTSTGVLSDAKALGELVKRVSPETLVILDGVCAVASEEIHQDDWNIDVVVGASQKGLSTPPGVSITTVSTKALKVLENRKTPVASYFANYKRWLPIMQSYENLTPAYFATPPVNLIYALEASLKQITEGSPSLEERFQIHREASKKFKKAAEELGFKQVATEPETAANGMTAVYVPEGIAPPALVGALGSRGIVIAGGLHKDIKTKYVRFGHMGVSVHPSRNDVDVMIKGLQDAVAEVKQQSA
ncbi:BZ3500_MvSof-1268-A1-R1_Chr2-2g04965 [Microbotryum saponariae]|uniref:alanine--glyoxylate transaminase n=1 Tax=Microbotryum saponariae TaxID=289078 RepID=A0A2X0K553_9BASI|nr:BZ3500_MvSof-1268-A1-R1_Chr2-2g04965 [Microbotryum saponariae]SDA00582.1 BZ3501_MvSof-1269-A2-R1_Chr2-2g04639 [Microbotryum saponariae]